MISAWIALVLFLSPQAISALAADAILFHLQEVATQNHASHEHDHHGHGHQHDAVTHHELSDPSLVSVHQEKSHKHRHAPGEPEHEHSVPTSLGNVSVGTLAASSYSASTPGLTPQITSEFPDQDFPLSPHLSSVLRPPIS